MSVFPYPALQAAETRPAATWAGARPGSEMPACSRLLPQIIPPANGEVEFQISGPQVHGAFEMKLCQIYGFGVRTEGNRGHFERVLPRAFRAEPQAPLPDQSTQSFCSARVLAEKCASLSKARQTQSTCLQMPSPAAEAALTALFMNSYNARESPHVLPSPLNPKTITADCTPFTLDAVKDFAGCCTKTSHAVFTESNIIFFFFASYLNFNI